MYRVLIDLAYIYIISQKYAYSGFYLDVNRIAQEYLDI